MEVDGVATVDPTAKIVGVDGKPIEGACVLKSENGRIVKLPTGTVYEGKKAETGFLVEVEEDSVPTLKDVVPIHVPAACDAWPGEFSSKPHALLNPRHQRSYQ